MNKSGHKGISILFTAPAVGVLLALDLVVLAVLFCVISIGLSSLPDVDIYLKDYDTVKFFDLNIQGMTDINILNHNLRHVMHIFIVRLALVLRNIQTRLIGKQAIISHSEFSVSHRGITHTVWYMAVVGFLFGFSSFVVLYSASILLPYEYAELLFIDILGVSVYVTSAVLFFAGFCSVLFHCIGDTFTPTGVNFASLSTDYGRSLRNLSFTVLGKEINPEFYYDNEVANRSASVFGFVGMSYAIFSGFYFGKINSLYLIIGFIIFFLLGIPLWLIIVKTRIGELIYSIYDFFA